MADESNQNTNRPAPAAAERLDSWKEIATYLKRAVRTVQRWEKEEGLPVHRHHHQKQGSVYAHRQELDAWWHQRQADTDRQGGRGKAGKAPRAVVVLPLLNMGVAAEADYLCDGITEEIIQHLSRLPGLHVSSRTSSFLFKNSNATPQEIGRRLQVDALLEGGLLQKSGRTRISARLVDAESGFPLWSETFELATENVFEIPEQIAERFRRDLETGRAVSSDRPAAGHPTGLAVYEDYLRGRHYWNERSRTGLEKSIVCFERAVARDPEYAPALAGLADVYNMLGYYSYRHPCEVFAKARQASTKALRIDSSLAEAHASQAFALMFERRDWKAAEQGFRRALRLNPGYATAHYWYGINLGCQGRPFEAIEQVRKAQELDPISPIIMAYVAGAYYFARQYRQGIDKCLQTIELEPRFPLARLILGWCYRESMQLDRAADSLRELLGAEPGHGDALAALGHLYGRMGHADKAKQQMERLKELPTTAYCSPGQIALVHLGLGEHQQALRLLEEAADQCYAWLVFAPVDPVFDPLKGEKAWTRILQKMNLTGR